MERDRQFPLGQAVTIAELEQAPHPLLARLREHEPVSWVPALQGWLVTRYGLALEVMRDAETFTVDDPRFSTSQVVGPSMLSLDGGEHERHRKPFVDPFRLPAVRDRFATAITEEATRLIDQFAACGQAELRREFAGPLAAATITHGLGLAQDHVPAVLDWYEAIVAAVTDITAGDPPPRRGRDAFEELRESLRLVIETGRAGPALAPCAELHTEETISNAAVLLFGGIETTEGMIANAALAVLEHPAQLEAAALDPTAIDAMIEESLRLEPAAAMIDRYATADAQLNGALIRAGDLVHLSITGANRDPAIFVDPDRFDPARPNVRRHLAFAQGPHVCLGVHLARLEARIGLKTLLHRLPQLHLDDRHPARATGLVFRKPAELRVLWAPEG